VFLLANDRRGTVTEVAGLTARVPWLCDPALQRVCPFWSLAVMDFHDMAVIGRVEGRTLAERE
jgi:hypothetical protein